ncbi:MAG: glycosyltransferase family 39 protein [Acidobacteriota bacterium]
MNVSVAAPSSSSPNRNQRWITSGSAIVTAVALFKLVLQLRAALHYGIFRDEMYYVACGQHLSWGYVDHPPLWPFVAWILSKTVGASLLALRLIPALCGGGIVLLTGALARRMGGGRMAQAMAAVGIVAAPIYMLMDHLFTMNAAEPLLWMLCAWCVLRFIDDGNPRWWLWIGVLCGAGLLLKYSIVFFAAGLIVGLALGPHRRVFASKWFWLGCAAAFLMFLPHLIWLVHHHFPFLEYEHNVRSTTRDVRRGPLAFFLDQAAILNPVSVFLWIGGLVWLLFTRAGSKYRILAWTFLVVYGVFTITEGKNYYVAPIYPMIFAAGGVAFTQWIRSVWACGAYTALLVVSGILLAPLTIPLLRPETFLRYQAALHLAPPKFENQRTGPLPQIFADEFGWEEMVRKTAAVYWSLPASERERTAIFANDWGEASAIDYFGPKYGLPRAICPHNSYWLWGPGNYDGSTVIVLGSDGTGDREHFQSVVAAGQVDNRWSRVDEHFTIWLCHGLQLDLKKEWPQMKKWG